MSGAKIELPNPALAWPIPYEAVVELCEDEGFSLVAYQCIAGVWTCGWGETEGVTPTTRWSKEYCEQRLLKSLEWRVRKIREMCKVPPNENQLVALLRLAYNIGLRDDKNKRGLYHTTVLRQHNAGNFEAAARAFALINKYRDPKTKRRVVSRGLTRRRALEAAWYLKPVGREDEMPQLVEPESGLASSPIAQSGAVTATVGGALGLMSSSDSLKTVVPVVDQIRQHFDAALAWAGANPLLLVAGVLVFVGLASIVQRAKQREEGWA